MEAIDHKDDRRKSVQQTSIDEPNSADHLLEALGYEPELTRTRSTLQVAFMSFVLASIPYGLTTTLFYPIAGGGPVTIIWGWLLVSLIILCVAISLGEITSVYPTAGGVYYQTFMLSPPKYKRIAAWICGWAYVVGNITITLAVNFGTTLFLVACINVWQVETGDPEAPLTGIFNAETYQVFLIFLAITLICNAVSALGNKWLPILDVRKSSLSRCALEIHVDLINLCVDFCHILDLRRRDSYHHNHPRARQERSSRCSLCLWPFRASIRLA